MCVCDLCVCGRREGRTSGGRGSVERAASPPHAPRPRLSRPINNLYLRPTPAPLDLLPLVSLFLAAIHHHHYHHSIFTSLFVPHHHHHTQPRTHPRRGPAPPRGGGRGSGAASWGRAAARACQWAEVSQYQGQLDARSCVCFGRGGVPLPTTSSYRLSPKHNQLNNPFLPHKQPPTTTPALAPRRSRRWTSPSATWSRRSRSAAACSSCPARARRRRGGRYVNERECVCEGEGGDVCVECLCRVFEKVCMADVHLSRRRSQLRSKLSVLLYSSLLIR